MNYFQTHTWLTAECRVMLLHGEISHGEEQQGDESVDSIV